jgi:TrmH family RNA methyltransferase
LTIAMTKITSRRHPLVQKCRQLATGRRRDDDVLLDGEHVIEEAIAANVPIATLIARDVTTPLARRARDRGADVYSASADVIAAASPVDTPTGVVAIARWRPAPIESTVTSTPGLTVALVDVQDPGNVGSVIRSADAFGAASVVAVGSTADPAGWKALRGAMGSTFHLPVGRTTVDALLARATHVKARLVATTTGNAEPLEAIRLDGPTVILLGNEGAGLSDAVLARAEARVRVPMRAGVNSLNVSVTAALILYEAARAHRAHAARHHGDPPAL